VFGRLLRTAATATAAVPLLLLALSGCAGPPFAERGGAPAAGTRANVDALLAAMTVEEKVGQLMVISFAGPAFSPEAEQMVRQYHAGGVILFQQNLLDADQIRQLTGRLQAAARLPLLIGVDQEGGPVIRVTQGVPIFPSAMAIGASFSPDVAAAVAAETARQLRGLGINVNFGPVVDVNSNPRNPIIGVRSYGGDPTLAGRLGAAAIEATQRAGVLAIAKHFPGHGDADVDSHRELPIIAQDLARLRAVEFPPFQAAIGAGVDGIMTAHVLLPALEPDQKRPATLSAPVLGYLREQLGYRGLIITDDLEMGAIVNDYGTAEAALLAFQAGADLLLFRRNMAEQQRAHALLVAAVREGAVPTQRLDASVRRILEAKARRGLLNGPTLALNGPTLAFGTAEPPHQKSLRTPEPSAGRDGRGAAAGALPAGPGSQHAGLALEVARRSLTLVKNEGGLLPLKVSPQTAVCVIHPRPAAVNGVEIALPAPPAGQPLSLGDAVQALHPVAQAVAIGLRPAPGEARAALACAQGAQLVVIGSYNLHEYPQQAALLKDVLALGRPSVVVALRLPYDLGEVAQATALLATYSNRPVSLQAAAEALFGKGPAPSGHLPVAVAPRWPLGFGLLDWGRPDVIR
jgi:beta-N-acetylhexosaminidase